MSVVVVGVADEKVAVGPLREHEVHIGVDQLRVVAFEALPHRSSRRAGDEGAVAEERGAGEHRRFEVAVRQVKPHAACAADSAALPPRR